MIIHYIYINANNVYDTNTEYFANVKVLHKNYYKDMDNVRYYTYVDILELLYEYDEELCWLFYHINHRYAALLADIGRYIILYMYGGMYHDLRFMSNINENDLNYNRTFVAEICPNEPYRVRNGNILLLQTKHPSLDTILQRIKSELILTKLENTKGSHNMFKIGSGTYITYCNENPTLVERDSFKFEESGLIYSGLERWQDVEDNIFPNII